MDFGEEHLDNRLISRRNEFGVQQAVCVGIDYCVQPDPLVSGLDHGFVNRDVIRIGIIKRL